MFGIHKMFSKYLKSCGCSLQKHSCWDIHIVSSLVEWELKEYIYNYDTTDGGHKIGKLDRFVVSAGWVHDIIPHPYSGMVRFISCCEYIMKIRLWWILVWAAMSKCVNIGLQVSMLSLSEKKTFDSTSWFCNRFRCTGKKSMQEGWSKMLILSRDTTGATCSKETGLLAHFVSIITLQFHKSI